MEGGGSLGDLAHAEHDLTLHGGRPPNSKIPSLDLFILRPFTTVADRRATSAVGEDFAPRPLRMVLARRPTFLLHFGRGAVLAGSKGTVGERTAGARV